jgi:hypothetical protein
MYDVYTAVLGFSKTAFFDMGCVYIDTCLKILLGKLNTHNFKNLPVLEYSCVHAVGSTIFFLQKIEKCKKNSSILSGGYRHIFEIVCIQLPQQNRRARVSVNATHVKKKSSFRKP